MSPPQADSQQQARFAALYDTCYSDVLRFVRRRAPYDVAEDLTHEAFLVAWRRFDDLPTAPLEARAWVFGAARQLIRSSGRTEARRDALVVQLQHVVLPVPVHSDHAAFRLDLVEAWRRLTPMQQEVLALEVWEQLPARLAADVLGISTTAYRVRLHRARTALRRHLGPEVPHHITASSRQEKHA